MCTVSFVAARDKVILTSNRDEQVARPALKPKRYRINGKPVIFPKDPKAGGTWFAVDDKANVIVLLNGADEKHQWNPPYRKSRGLVVLDLIGSESPYATWQDIELFGIEPFTIVLYEAARLYQLRWNGEGKSCDALNASHCYIWSSSTLYPKDIRNRRAQWFARFLDTKPDVTEAEMFDFHRYTETEDAHNGLIINRKDALKTLSITQAVIAGNKVRLLHHDLVAQKESAESFLIV